MILRLQVSVLREKIITEKDPGQLAGIFASTPEIPHFPPPQPDHTVRGGDRHLFHIGDPGLDDPVSTDDQLAVLTVLLSSEWHNIIEMLVNHQTQLTANTHVIIRSA